MEARVVGVVVLNGTLSLENGRCRGDWVVGAGKCVLGCFRRHGVGGRMRLKEHEAGEGRWRSRRNGPAKRDQSIVKYESQPNYKDLLWRSTSDFTI